LPAEYAACALYVRTQRPKQDDRIESIILDHDDWHQYLTEQKLLSPCSAVPPECGQNLSVQTPPPIFFFGDLVVGEFSTGFYPTQNGEVRYMPFRGPGHIQLQAALRSDGGADCHFKRGGERTAFRVNGCPRYGVLAISGLSGEDRNGQHVTEGEASLATLKTTVSVFASIIFFIASVVIALKARQYQDSGEPMPNGKGGIMTPGDGYLIALVVGLFSVVGLLQARRFLRKSRNTGGGKASSTP
jgi:hypothetical protein